MDRYEYIEAVISHISNKSKSDTIRQELNNHIDDRIEYYTDAGYSQDDACAKAIQRMGNPDEIGKRLDKLHSNDIYIWLCAVFALLFIINNTISLVINDYDFGLYACVLIVMNYISYGLAYYYAYKSDLNVLFIPLHFIALIFGFLFYCHFIPYFEYAEIESGFQYNFLSFIDMGFCVLVILTIIISIIYTIQDKKSSSYNENKVLYSICKLYYKFLLVFVIAVSAFTIVYTVYDIIYSAYI